MSPTQPPHDDTAALPDVHEPSLADILRRSDLSGVYALPFSGRGGVEHAVAACGHRLLVADCEDSEDVGIVLALLGRDLQLPDYYGANYDALADCLTDDAWAAPAGGEVAGQVLVIAGADPLKSADPEGFDTLCAVFAAAAEFWREAGVPFWVFFDLPADGLVDLPILPA